MTCATFMCKNHPEVDGCFGAGRFGVLEIPCPKWGMNGMNDFKWLNDSWWNSCTKVTSSSFHNIQFLDTTKERERSMLTALQGEARELPKLDEGLEDKAGAAAQLSQSWSLRGKDSTWTVDRFGDFFGHTHRHDTTRHRQDMTLLYFTDIHNHTHIHIHSKFLGFWNGSHFFPTTTLVLSDMRIRARMDTVIPAPWGPRQCRLDLDGAT